jgi:hypothetical protein
MSTWREHAGGAVKTAEARTNQRGGQSTPHATLLAQRQLVMGTCSRFTAPTPESAQACQHMLLVLFQGT